MPSESPNHRPAGSSAGTGADGPQEANSTGQIDAGNQKRDRYAILLDAEVGRLVHELRSFGVLTQAELAQRTHADLWGTGAFQTALKAGERRNQLDVLPFGFVSTHRDRDADGTSSAGQGK